MNNTYIVNILRQICTKRVRSDKKWNGIRSMGMVISDLHKSCMYIMMLLGAIRHKAC